MKTMISGVFGMLLMCASLASAQAPGVIQRKAWSYDRSDLAWPYWAKAEDRKKEGSLNSAQGWADYDIDIPAFGWYALWQTGIPSSWLRDVLVDGQMVMRLHSTTDADVDPADKSWAKECNLYLTAGKHTLRYRRFSFPGVLPARWELRPAGENPAASIRAMATSFRVVAVGKPVNLEVLLGSAMPMTYELMLKDVRSGKIIDGPTVSAPATTSPVTRKVQIVPSQPSVYRLLAKVGDKTLTPSDLGLGQIIAIADKLDAAPSQAHEKLVVDIDCLSKPGDNYFENGQPSVIINKPFGSYRQTAGPILEGHWGVQSFAYKVDLPDSDHIYKLVVDYPDDDRRTMGFWVNDGAKRAGHSNGVVMTGGVETGDRYPLTHRMLTHEAWFYPRNNKGVVFAVVNLAPGYQAAASRIRVYQLVDGMPAGQIGHSRGRMMGYYFEEPGRWLKHFGGESNDINEHLLTLKRWAVRNRMMGANVMMPTINVYQANLYPSKILEGYFNQSDDTCRMAALISDAYGGKFVPEFHLSGQPNFDRIKMGVWNEGRKVHFGSREAHDWVQVSSDGKYATGAKAFVYNVLHPKVQAMYLSVIGELADRLKDCDSFAGISSRLMLNWQWQGWNAMPGLNFGYNDWTIHQFEADTGIKVPGQDGKPDRFGQRFLFLTGPMRDKWVKWRCDRVFAFHKKLRDRIRQAKPDAQLFLPFHGVDQRACLSDDPIEQLLEIGIDPKNYASEPGIVLMPRAMYGRRRSTPMSDSTKWEQAIGKVAHTLGRLGGRGFNFYSDYFEVNKHFDWTKLGGNPYDAFDACAPSGLNERELYAIALAQNDSSFMINGGNGNIFGTPSVMLPFLREYRALPNVQFEPLDAKAGGRDPVAVWQKQVDGKLYCYAVNRLPVPVQVTMQVSEASQIVQAADDKPIAVDSQGNVRFTLEPYMLKSMVATGSSARVVHCKAHASDDFEQQVKHVIDQIKPLDQRVTKRKTAVQLTAEQAADAQQLMDQAIDAQANGQIWQAWANCFRPPLVNLYNLTSDYPDGLYDRQYPHGLVTQPDAPKLKMVQMIGDVRGHVADVDALCFASNGDLYAASNGQLMCIASDGTYKHDLTLVANNEIPYGDISKRNRLDPPSYISSIHNMSMFPGDKLAIATGWGSPSVYERQHGRLLESFSQIKAHVYEHILRDSDGHLLITVGYPKNKSGLWRIGKGWKSAKNQQRLDVWPIKGLAMGAKGTLYLTHGESIRRYDSDGNVRTELKMQMNHGPRLVAVSPDGSKVFVTAVRGATLVCLATDPNDPASSLTLAWQQNFKARGISAIAVNHAGELALGFESPADDIAVKRFAVGDKQLEPLKTMLTTLAPIRPQYLKDSTQLKVYHGKIYFLSDNNLCTLDPADNDTIHIVYQSHVRRTEIEAFAIASNGDLYLAANSGFEANTRGTNVYVAKRDGNRWTQPIKLNGGKPLVANPYKHPTDIAFDAKGRLLIVHEIKDKEHRGMDLPICAVDVNEKGIVSSDVFCDMGNAYGWGGYGLYRAADGRTLVAGETARSIACVAADGSIAWKTKYSADQGHGTLPLRGPTGITMDAMGRTWVADTAGNQILCFDTQGKLLGQYGHFGNIDQDDDLALCRPVGIASVTREGKQWLYVADINNQRIIKLEVN